MENYKTNLKAKHSDILMVMLDIVDAIQAGDCDMEEGKNELLSKNPYIESTPEYNNYINWVNETMLIYSATERN